MTENNKAWISKTDITEYLRCPYRVYVSHKRGVRAIDFVDSAFIDSLLAKGTQFEDLINQTMPASPKTFSALTKEINITDGTLTMGKHNYIENHQLQIRGMPDRYRIEEGQAIPIEIKNHKTVEKSDRLELGFYRLLLSKLSSKAKAFDFFEDWRKPRIFKGYIILNTGEEVEVNLTNEDFHHTLGAIEETRRIKEYGCEPILTSECNTCDLQEECALCVREKEGVSLINGVGYVRTKMLQEVGIVTLGQLYDASELDIYAELLTKYYSRKPYYIQSVMYPDFLRIIKKRAESWIERKPIQIDSNFKLDYSDYIVLDLEYDPWIWLVGLLVCNNGDRVYHQYFAENEEEEVVILTQLMGVLGEHSSLPVVTYGGLSADIKKLEAAIPSEVFNVDEFSQRHLDLYQVVQKDFCFPIKSYGLKSLGQYLGFERKFPDMDGLEARDMYDSFLRKKSRKGKDAIKGQLLEYNKEDLDGTKCIFDKLKEDYSQFIITTVRKENNGDLGGIVKAAETKNPRRKPLPISHNPLTGNELNEYLISRGLFQLVRKS